MALRFVYAKAQDFLLCLPRCQDKLLHIFRLYVDGILLSLPLECRCVRAFGRACVCDECV